MTDRVTTNGNFDWLEEQSEPLKNDINRVNSVVYYYEFLPTNSNKGAMIEKTRTYSAPEDNIIAVGDFYNNLEMIQLADIGICAENAPEDLQKEADYVAVHHTQSLIYDIVHRIIPEILNKQNLGQKK